MRCIIVELNIKNYFITQQYNGVLHKCYCKFSSLCQRISSLSRSSACYRHDNKYEYGMLHGVYGVYNPKWQGLSTL